MSSRKALELELARLRARYADQPSGRVFAPLADCQRKLGQLDNALQTCLAGLTRHPVYSSAQLILGKIFLDRGEDVSARVALERVLELDSHNMLALRLLAELAERRGELDEAESRWTQLAATDYDAELTDERLETIALLREQQAGPVTREPAAEPSERDLDGPAIEETAVEQDTSEAGHDSSAEEEDIASVVLETKGAPSSEIATLTLAGIYAEQGFKAKALEIYRQIESRNPDLPGLRECIESIESAFARVKREVVEELGADDDNRSGGLEVVARTRGVAEEDALTGPVPSEPLFAVDGETVDPVGRDASRYERFGSWLERVRPDDDD
jgi:tetratricopeptide (TPR) repeat protein